MYLFTLTVVEVQRTQHAFVRVTYARLTFSVGGISTKVARWVTKLAQARQPRWRLVLA